MPSDTFYNENSQALEKVNIVTRDSLGSLAVEILASKTDLSTISDVSDYQKLVRNLYDIIEHLHYAYEHLNL